MLKWALVLRAKDAASARSTRDIDLLAFASNHPEADQAGLPLQNSGEQVPNSGLLRGVWLRGLGLSKLCIDLLKIFQDFVDLEVPQYDSSEYPEQADENDQSEDEGDEKVHGSKTFDRGK
ncbi:MAG: hypothetical protein H6686_06585 [Fibrobacteria bacterium]|nr:hypothetical protein [Fibrobacteria bacterium]